MSLLCMFNFLHFPIFRKFHHHPIGIIINIKKFVNLGGIFSSGFFKLFLEKSLRVSWLKQFSMAPMVSEIKNVLKIKISRIFIYFWSYALDFIFADFFRGPNILHNFFQETYLNWELDMNIIEFHIFRFPRAKLFFKWKKKLIIYSWKFLVPFDFKCSYISIDASSMPSCCFFCHFFPHSV